MLDSQKIIASLQEGGAVAEKLPMYEPRQAQLDLLSLIIRAFNEDSLLMAEAGTGVGKSFAYLLPAMHFALQNKEKVVISTATITLQQQLFEKDIPLVASAIGEKTRAVIMKGRGNYICMRRLNEALREPPLDSYDFKELSNIAQFAQTSKSGGRSELSFMPSDTVWSSVCSESDLCLGGYCPFRENCFILNLRKEANNAHIIVANHHLLFADLAARFQGAGYENAVVLPPFSRLIIDEAHTIETAATSFFSSSFSRAGISRQLSRLYQKRRTGERGLLVRLCAMLPPCEDPLKNITGEIEKVRSASEELDECTLQLCGAEGIFRLSASSDESFLERDLFVRLKTLRKNILSLTNVIRKMTETLKDEDNKEPVVWEIKTIIRRLENTAEICDAFCNYKKHEDEVLWIERHGFSKDEQRTASSSAKSRKSVKVQSLHNSQAVWTRTPLDLSVKLKDSVFAPNKTVVCVSATLAINNDFSYWGSRCGLTTLSTEDLSAQSNSSYHSNDNTIRSKVWSGCFPSPFPYSNAVLLASPMDAPLVNEEGYQEFVNQAVIRLAATAGGSALVLFTSYQSLSSAYMAAKDELASIGIRCLKQGDDDRTRLLQDFISDTSSCLFATDSFWEGVDAPGDTLRLVIICRLPFRTPGDPVLEARREAIEKRGGSSFMELSLPQAVMKFKQGFGRLMRRSGDHGVVVVLDSRLLKKNYGQLFLHSLPETRKSFTDLNNILVHMENFLF